MKTFTLRLEEDKIDAILMGLRYLELHHPIVNNFNHRPEFKNLLNEIYLQVKQTSLFQEE